MNKYDYKKQYQMFKNIKASDQLKNRILQIPAQGAKKTDVSKAIIIVASAVTAVLAIVLIACIISFSRSNSREYEKIVLADPVSEDLSVETAGRNEPEAIQTLSPDQSEKDDISVAEEMTEKMTEQIQNIDVYEEIYPENNTESDTDIYIPVIRVASDESAYEAETEYTELTYQDDNTEAPAVGISEPGKDQGEHLQQEGETFWWGVYDPASLNDKELNQQQETTYQEHPGKDHVWEHIIAGNEEWDHCILCGINTNFGFLDEDPVITNDME